jgi:hypothetical protein
MPSISEALGGHIRVRRTGGPWTEVVGSVLGYSIVRMRLNARGDAVFCSPDLAFMANQVVPCFRVAGHSVVELTGGLVFGRERVIARTMPSQHWGYNLGETAHALRLGIAGQLHAMATQYIAQLEQQFISAPGLWLTLLERLLDSQQVWGSKEAQLALRIEDEPHGLSRCRWALYDRGNLPLFLHALLGIAPIARSALSGISRTHVDTLEVLAERNRCAAEPDMNALEDSSEWVEWEAGSQSGSER